MPLAPELTLSACGPVVAIRGDASPLFLVMRRRAVVARGAARIAGVALEDATALGAVGLAPRAAELPPRWSAEDLLTASGSLAGWSRGEARACARESLAALGLEQLRGKACAKLGLLERRAVAAACASLRLPGGGPRVLAFEEPFAGLDPASAEWLAAVLEGLGRGRALVWAAARGDWQPAVARLAAGGEVVDLFEGQRVFPVPSPPGSAPGYLLVAADPAGRLRAALERRGARVVDAPSAGAVAAGHARLLVSLSAGHDESDLTEAALDADAALLELCALEPTPAPSA